MINQRGGSAQLVLMIGGLISFVALVVTMLP